MKLECLKESESNWKITLSTDEEPNISSLWLGEYQMKYGASLLRMGGIGGVGTGEAYRHQGFARRIMDESKAWMSNQDFDVAMLFGIGILSLSWIFNSTVSPATSDSTKEQKRPT